MKKYHLYLWLVTLVGLMTSCSQEETADALQTNTGSDRVSLTASLPEDFAQIGTRAPLPSVSEHQLRCILEVWTKDASPVLKYREEKAGLSGDNVVFDFTIEDATYDCLFWADFIATNAETDASASIGSVTYTHYADKYYATNTDNGLRAVSITGTDYVEGGEFTSDARDAFFSHAELEKIAGQNKTLSTSLTRPFAKLIIKEKNKEAFEKCAAMGINYTVPKTFNVLTGTASGDYSVPSREFYPEGYGNNNDLTLFSDLIFTSSDTRETLGQISLTFQPYAGVGNPDFQPIDIPAGIPLQRNYKTNATGSLLSVATNKATVTVTMDAEWTTPDVEHNIDDAVWDGKYPTSEAQAKEWMGAETSGTGETDGSKHVFTITTPRQLAALHVLVMNNTELSGTNTKKEYKYATYKLANDIDLANAQWSPIGHKTGGYTAFTGKFDGQAHKISRLNVAGEWTASGLFAGIISEGVIKNVMVKGKVASSYNNNTVSIAVGGIAGSMSNATIAFCSFEGTTDASSANVSSLFIGGICGRVSTEATVDNYITSCFANTTPVIPQGLNDNNVSKGGIGGTNNGGVNIHFKGCTWYYKSGASPEGIEACYKDWTSSGDGDNKNASYSNFSGLSNRLDDMNSYNSDVRHEYEYEWAIENDILKLQPKK